MFRRACRASRFAIGRPSEPGGRPRLVTRASTVLRDTNPQLSATAPRRSVQPGDPNDRPRFFGQDVMTPDQVVAHEEDPAEPLLSLFEQRDVNVVPVVKCRGPPRRGRDEAESAALFRQVTGHGTIHPAGSSDLKVRDLMDARSVWVEATDALDAVVHRMTRHHVRSVPVVERLGHKRRLVGMVSWGDLLRGWAGAGLRPSPDR